MDVPRRNRKDDVVRSKSKRNPTNPTTNIALHSCVHMCMSIEKEEGSRDVRRDNWTRNLIGSEELPMMMRQAENAPRNTTTPSALFRIIITIPHPIPSLPIPLALALLCSVIAFHNNKRGGQLSIQPACWSDCKGQTHMELCRLIDRSMDGWTGQGGSRAAGDEFLMSRTSCTRKRITTGP